MNVKANTYCIMDLPDLKKAVKESSIKKLQNIIGNKMHQAKYGSFFCSNQTFNGLYRARAHNHILGSIREGKLQEFTNEKEYWNPSKENIKWRGRCNDIKESMFYCSNEFEVAVSEVRPTMGDYVTVSVFKNIDFGDTKGKLYRFRMKPIGIDYLSKIKGFKSCIDDSSGKKRSKEFLKMDTFLDELFHEKVEEKENYKYKLSIAVTNIMLTNTINQHGEEHSIHGLMYSSVARNFKGVNILLKPLPVNNYFFLETAQTFKVIESNKEQITLQLKRNGRTILQRTHPSQPNMDMEWFEIEKGDTCTIKN